MSVFGQMEQEWHEERQRLEAINKELREALIALRERGEEHVGACGIFYRGGSCSCGSAEVTKKVADALAMARTKIEEETIQK